jgi:hypothetical protein
MKVDLTKLLKDYYSAPRDPELASFEAGQYLSIEGAGEPGGREFSQKVEALYPTAYGVKKLCKLKGKDFAVPKLEGLWWVDGNQDARKVPRAKWRWKLLIRMPEFVTNDLVELAKTQVCEKKKSSLVSSISFEKIKNGKCVHVLHTGPYSEEENTIHRMHGFIEKEGLKSIGFHHEIYLSDPRKTVPSKMKTVLRQAVGLR